MKTKNDLHVTEQPEDIARGSSSATGSASPDKADDSHGPWVAGGEDDYEEDSSCHYCGGEGWKMGDELDDPMWYDPETVYKCPCCNGSGDAKDCTFW